MPVHLRPVLATLLALAAPAAAAASGGESAGGAFVTMAPIDVPIVDGDRSDGRLLLTLVLRAADAAAATRLTAALPALREASIATASEFARLHASPNAPVDAGVLADRLNRALHARDAGVAQVLLVAVSARRR